jgi:hypothetical protein
MLQVKLLAEELTMTTQIGEQNWLMVPSQWMFLVEFMTIFVLGTSDAKL